MKTRRTVASKKEIASSYDKLFESPGRLRDADALYYWVLDLLHTRPGGKLLDVACGEGVLVRAAQERGLQSIGIDLSMQAARISARDTSGALIAVGNGESLPFDSQSFDYVTNLGSLEHFGDLRRGVHEMRRVLRPDGLAAILLPNSYYLADIIWHVWRTGYTVSHKQPIERFAPFGEWREILEKDGLHVLRGYKYNFRFPRTRKDWQWYFRHKRKLLYLAIAPFVPFHLSYSFLFICSPTLRHV